MPRVVIERKENDPLCCRASIGGTDEIGYYLTYRNNPRDVLKAIEIVTVELKKLIEAEDLLNAHDGTNSN
jgi:hypothetical protein